MALTVNFQNFQQKKWYVIHDQNNTEYGEGSENGRTIIFETKTIKSSLSFRWMHIFLLQET